MSSLSNLKSADLEPLFPSEFYPSVSPLRTLILNNTGIGDDAAPFIGSCEQLETLEVASTKFTSAISQSNPSQSISVLTVIDSADGIFAIIDSCKKLKNLDVTSCRQIPIVDRRRIFEGGRNPIISPFVLTSPIGVGGIQRMRHEHHRESRVLHLTTGMRLSLKDGLH